VRTALNVERGMELLHASLREEEIQTLPADGAGQEG
jgi:hypothetical protein